MLCSDLFETYRPLAEAFKTTPVEISKLTDKMWRGIFHVGEKTFHMLFVNMGSGWIDVGFSDKSKPIGPSHKNTNELGTSSIRVYSKVISTIEAFLKEHLPQKLTFQSYEGNHDLYARLVQYMEPALNAMRYSSTVTPGKGWNVVIDRWVDGGAITEDADDAAGRLARAEAQGFSLPLFHKTSATFDAFAPFSHFGTEAQAKMRGGLKTSRVLPVLVRGTRFKRVKDIGRDQWDLGKLRALERQGYDGIVYLNRYEGIPLEEFDALNASGRDETRLGDTAFKKFCPSAADSYIIFDPRNVRSVDAAFDPAAQGKTGLML
jgi:hypothetical protein